MQEELDIVRGERDRLEAENQWLRQRADFAEMLLKSQSVLPPLDASRQRICEAVEEWARRTRDGKASVYEVARALMEAATSVGWLVAPIASPEAPVHFPCEIKRLVASAERADRQMLAFLLEAALIEAKKSVVP